MKEEKPEFFLDPNLVFTAQPSALTKEQIFDYIPIDFQGRAEFVDFYLDNDGVVFPAGAFYYRDNFYPVAEQDYNLLDVGAFFPMEKIQHPMHHVWLEDENEYISNFNPSYLPFGNDASGNQYCIACPSGIVVYIPYEAPNEITKVAPSFLDFCQHIQASIN